MCDWFWGCEVGRAGAVGGGASSDCLWVGTGGSDAGAVWAVAVGHDSDDVAWPTGESASCRQARAWSDDRRAVLDLIVVADPGGAELRREPAPRELKSAQHTLRALHRKAARQIGPWDELARTKREPSKGWARTQQAIGRAHTRVAQLRRDRLHKLTTQLSQTHEVIGAETLAVKNMMRAGGSRKRGLNRSLADAGLG